MHLYNEKFEQWYFIFIEKKIMDENIKKYI